MGYLDDLLSINFLSVDAGCDVINLRAEIENQSLRAGASSPDASKRFSSFAQKETGAWYAG